MDFASLVFGVRPETRILKHEAQKISQLVANVVFGHVSSTCRRSLSSYVLFENAPETQPTKFLY